MGFLGSDPYINNVLLLLHCNGANNSTVFTDSSIYGDVPVRTRSPVISTATSKFGGSSIYFSSTATDTQGDMLTFSGSRFNSLAQGDFTIEMFFCGVNVQYYSRLLNINSTWAANSACINWDAGKPIRFSAFNLANPLLDTGVVPTLTVWHHIALTRSSGTFYLFLNGVLRSVVTETRPIFNTTNNYITLGCGNGSVGGFSPFNGYIDEVRITQGIARYTSNFQLPQEAFPNP
jgi:hypothetical protein